MKKLSTILILLLLISCSSKNQNQKVKPIIKSKKQVSINYNIGLKFINEYTKLCNKAIIDHDTTWNIKDWINKNDLLSNNFKNRYNFILDSAEKASPDYGLGFDPIFDAQDFPDNGFEIDKIDSSKNFITVIGIDWKFRLTLKVINQNNKTLVDGVGIINIPKNRQRNNF